MTKFQPGDFVILDRMSVQLLYDSFQLSKTPAPSYASQPAGTFSDGQLALVLGSYLEEDVGGDEFAWLLTPTCVGWLSVYYLELFDEPTGDWDDR